jgi:hypothetical protein
MYAKSYLSFAAYLIPKSEILSRLKSHISHLIPKSQFRNPKSLVIRRMVIKKLLFGGQPSVIDVGTALV